MAELSIAASALQVAQIGLEVAKILTGFCADVQNADKDIEGVDREFSVAALALDALGTLLKDHDNSRLYSQQRLYDAQLTVQAYRVAFKELDAGLDCVLARNSSR